MKLQAILLLLLTSVIWGFGFIAQRLGMDHIGPYSFNVFRFLLGALSLLPLVYFLGKKKTGQPKAGKPFWIIGGLAGYYGGWVDNLTQRGIEILRSFPELPLWMALSAALPVTWSPIIIYFGITIILGLLDWTGLARAVRSKLLAVREEDFVTAAILMGAPPKRVIARHMLPSFMSHLIASATLSVPNMILGETALSFLGLGLRPPITSWGVLLSEAQNMNVVALYPWLMLPVLPVIVVVLAFNFLGDGLRDAADPYK